jgi:hypothetical protein
MSVQEISVTNNQKKQILKTVKKASIVFQEENGDVVLNVDAYIEFMEDKEKDPVTDIFGEGVVDLDNEYVVFS